MVIIIVIIVIINKNPTLLFPAATLHPLRPNAHADRCIYRHLFVLQRRPNRLVIQRGAGRVHGDDPGDSSGEGGPDGKADIIPDRPDGNIKLLANLRRIDGISTEIHEGGGETLLAHAERLDCDRRLADKVGVGAESKWDDEQPAADGAHFIRTAVKDKVGHTGVRRNRSRVAAVNPSLFAATGRRIGGSRWEGA